MVLKVARRYANAFLQIGIEQNILDRILEDVLTIYDTIQNSRELKLFLRSPIIKSDEKRTALNAIFDSSVEPLTMQFLELITKKGRENLIEQIMKAFIDLYKKYSGIIDIDVFTAMEMPDSTRADLKKALEQTTRLKVDLNYNKDSGLIGGMAVRIDDTVIDGTIKHKIDQLRKLFKETSVDLIEI